MPPPPLPGLVPAWLDRLAQFGWRILLGVALVALLVLHPVTAVPLVVIPSSWPSSWRPPSSPLVQWLMRRGRTRARAAAIARRWRPPGRHRGC